MNARILALVAVLSLSTIACGGSDALMQPSSVDDVTAIHGLLRERTTGEFVEFATENFEALYDAETVRAPEWTVSGGTLNVGSGGIVNDGVLSRLDAAASGEVLVPSRAVTHPAFEAATVRTPTLLRLTADDAEVYETECFGPVAYLIETSGTEQSIDLFRDTVQRHGAMTAAVYSTSGEVVDEMREAALDAGVALSENLLGGVFVNQSAAFSDFHGTGANPAANASYTDGAYVAPRFRVVQSRRHV